MPERPCCLSSTFSGFISQWIILFLYSVSRHWSREWANLRTSCSENPWNLFFLINSYRLIDKSSNVMHVCDLKQKGVSFQKSGSPSHAQECSTAYLETSYFKMAKKIAPILHIKTLQCWTMNNLWKANADLLYKLRLLINHLNEKLSNMWMILQVLSLSCFLRCSRILISSCACRWNLFSFLTILRATCWWVLWSYTLSTWPNEPLPITFRISYLRWKIISHFFSYLLQYCHLWKRWWGMKKGGWLWIGDGDVDCEWSGGGVGRWIGYLSILSHSEQSWNLFVFFS